MHYNLPCCKMLPMNTQNDPFTHSKNWDQVLEMESEQTSSPIKSVERKYLEHIDEVPGGSI